MPPPTKTQSIHFTRAAVRETRRLHDLRRAAAHRVRKIEAELSEAVAAEREIEERILALEQLAGERAATDPPAEPQMPGRGLSGARIREVAIKVLRESSYAGGPIHYR